mmetsp:Transcript_9747/g.23991  ORF Transcript_9747/g.23991 Transcript_9747/m.23991 type:complete len:221 (-) Transcript_9747:397-1059(-)
MPSHILVSGCTCTSISVTSFISSITATLALSATCDAAETDRFLPTVICASTMLYGPILRKRTLCSDSTPPTPFMMAWRRLISSASTVSVRSDTLCHTISAPVCAIMTPTSPPATGSIHGNPTIDPPIPKSATAEAPASARWCQAFAITVGLRAFSPAFRVMWNMASLTTTQMTDTQRAMLPGTGTPSEPVTSSKECHTRPPPAPTSRVDTERAPIDSYLP